MKKIDAFWDSSALVPLCVDQGGSAFARAAERNKSIAVWWGTPLEMTGAFCRLLRSADMDRRGFEMAKNRLAAFRTRWVEVLPTERLRELGLSLMERHPLRAADAAQLAAALVWSGEQARQRPFICLDGRLAAAAAQEGFAVEIL